MCGLWHYQIVVVDSPHRPPTVTTCGDAAQNRTRIFRINDAPPRGQSANAPSLHAPQCLHAPQSLRFVCRRSCSCAGPARADSLPLRTVRPRGSQFRHSLNAFASIVLAASAISPFGLTTDPRIAVSALCALWRPRLASTPRGVQSCALCDTAVPSRCEFTRRALGLSSRDQATPPYVVINPYDGLACPVHRDAVARPTRTLCIKSLGAENEPSPCSVVSNSRCSGAIGHTGSTSRA